MKKIDSFKINHRILLPGLYISGHIYDDNNKIVATTFDLRLKAPNREPVLNTAEVHTIEHLGATFLRNNVKWKDKIVYFGPMGCRTGFYLIILGEIKITDIKNLLIDCFEYIYYFVGKIPGATEFECGNYLDQNLSMAHYEAGLYLKNVLKNLNKFNTNYPK